MTVLIVNIDGACRGNPGPASVGVVVRDASGRVLKEHGRRIGQATNNIAEYTALADALDLARGLGGETLRVRSDSELLVRQYRGVYRVKNPELKRRLAEIRSLASGFKSVDLAHVPREENVEADRLANEALDGRPAAR